MLSRTLYSLTAAPDLGTSGERQRHLASKRSRAIVGISSGHVFGTAVGAPLPCQINPSCHGYGSRTV